MRAARRDRERCQQAEAATSWWSTTSRYSRPAALVPGTSSSLSLSLPPGQSLINSYEWANCCRRRSIWPHSMNYKSWPLSAKRSSARQRPVKELIFSFSSFLFTGHSNSLTIHNGQNRKRRKRNEEFLVHSFWARSAFFLLNLGGGHKSKYKD